MAGHSAYGQDVPLFTEDFPPEEFRARRERVYDALGANALALIQGAPSPSGYARFRQSNSFYYLSGVESPHAYLLLDSAERETRLYLPHRNPGRERSEGKLLSAEDESSSEKVRSRMRITRSSREARTPGTRTTIAAIATYGQGSFC